MGLKSGRTRSSLRNVSVGRAIPDSGVSRWEFEDDSDTTTAIDTWGNNDGAINGATYTATSAVGSSALDFDGTDDDVDLPTYQYSGPWSFSFWVNIDSISLAGYIYGDVNSNDESGVRFYTNDFDSTPKITFRQRSSTGSDIFKIGVSEFAVTGSYQMATVTSDGSTVTVYRNDANQVGSASVSTAGTIGTNPFFGIASGFSGYYDGQLDDFRIYTKELSSAEVSSLYNNGSI